MNDPKETPMVRQYLSIKEKYNDAILFYRMGDFYEMFFEDAVTASKILEITLTSRNKKNEDAIPMCGIPARAADSYIGRLIDKGYKVAICEQTEDPALAKGLVQRDVIRIITPGMIVDNNLLDEKSNNYILAISANHSIMGISFLDISTGTFRMTESDRIDAVMDESLRIAPSEILLPESMRAGKNHEKLLQAFSEKLISFLPDKEFNPKTGREILIEQFRTRSLEGFGCEDATMGIGAAGALLAYVRETQKQKTEHLNHIEPYSLDGFLMVDEMSCRNLELMENIRSGKRTGTLLGIMDQCITAMGSRRLKQWLRYPLIDMDRIRKRLNAVAEGKSEMECRFRVRESLKSIYDMERLTGKITMGRANARDLTALKNSLKKIPEIVSILSGLTSEEFQLHPEYKDQTLEKLKDLADLIEKAIREDAPPVIHEGGMIKSGYHEKLDELIRISQDGKGWLVRLEAAEKEKTKINSLKVKYNKIFGYYIEVPRTHAESVPEHYIRKQTLVNAERYITEELKTFETKVLNAHELMADLEYRLFTELREKIIMTNTEILKTADFLASVDCLFNLSEVAEQNNYTQPEINTDGVIDIREGRHPVVEKLITGERYIPNDIRLDNAENQILMITGPNMAGKSTVLRQVAILSILAQMGSFVPARNASLCVTDRIFTRVGALDNLSSGRSTFMVEMEETANIMNNATPRSLVIMDEIGRGTSTYDGLSIAWAVAEYLHDLEGKGVKTLFATHYHELTDLADQKPRVRNFNIAVKEWNDEIIFLRKLVEGSTNRSYGIQVARLAGIPESIVRRAKKVLSRVERDNRNGSGLKKQISTGEESKGQVQLSLFQKPDEIIIRNLQKLNILTMTPIDAINYLCKLKEKADSIVT
ncbi:MAG: DNA mismatch repair protein MutS [Desulfobacteraceae bacterium]|nr:MAG: DNA mismatch repair protein MutS [Desulfobacteraceae bacterium]